ncbi:SpoIIE family protein phosphatase [Streptomyces sp. NPDC051987]|uniref:SpoIIE family protein phosphatase n=1 Tax=Streptomyces sp. NPDC051987 TaxID=3155808 RepID=UPI00342438C5
MDVYPPIGVVVIDRRGLVIGWTPGAERLLGHTSAEARGRSVAELLDAPALAGGESVRGGAVSGHGELHPDHGVRHKDGRRLSVAVTRCPLAPGADGTGGGSGTVLLIGPPSGPEAERLRQSLSGWVLQDSPLALTVYDTDLRSVWHSAAMQRLSGMPDEAGRGRGLTEVLAGPDAVEWEERMRLAMATGEEQVGELKGTVLTGLGSRVFSVSATPLRDAEGRTLGVCALVGDVTERRRARERLSLLNDASLHIGSTLDMAQTARELTEVSVPRFTDVARVDLLELILRGEEPAPGPLAGPAQLRRIAELTLSEGVTTAQQTAGEADVYLAHSPAALCLATGRSALYRTNEAPPIRSYIDQTPERQAKVRRLGTHSWILVPVKARGTTLGVVWFTRTRETPESFEADDLSLAEDLVARAAVCLDNARRFTRERAAALTLQRSLLPQRMPEQSAVEAAFRYLPAEQSSGVGGDWFDVIALSGARVALVVGDVVGHGMYAAAAMGRLRAAVQTLADVDLAPDELLTRLDDLVLRLSAESGADAEPAWAQAAGDIGATCLYAVYDPVSRRCSMALAGHPPPAVLGSDGSAEFLDVPVGPPLGLGGLPFESVDVALPEGSLLALYTDGLIHSGHRDLGEGLEALREALAMPMDSLDSLCDHVVRELLPAGPADDAALLLVRPRTLDERRVAVWDVEADASAVARIRSDAVRALDQWGLEEAAFVTELLVSELVTNAIRYGDPPIQLRLINDRVLICEVSDSSSTAPHLRRARVFDEGGRGLLLVAQLTERWGTRQTAAGKTIWCEQSLSAGDGPFPPVEGTVAVADARAAAVDLGAADAHPAP